MATGRGLFNKQFSDHLKKQKPEVVIPALHRVPPNPTHSRAKQEKSKDNSTISPQRKNNTKSHHSEKSYIETIPPELWLKIFSHLDPVSLLSVGSVNRYFYKLSKDNLIWYAVFTSYTPMRSYSWKPKTVAAVQLQLSATDLNDKEPGYWKNIFMSQMITHRKKRIQQILHSVKSISGVPANIEKAVKLSGLTWAVTFKDTSGKETVMKQMDICFSHTSLSVVWCGLVWPCIKSLTTVQVHGVTPMIFDKYISPSKKWPNRLSLIAEYDLRSLMESCEYIGQDKYVKLLHLKPGLLLALWKKSFEIAFVIATLHYHQLLELSTLGSADNIYTFPPHAPVLDDIDPNYGLHGYQLHIDMHSGLRTYLCGTYRSLFCRKEYIKDGFLRLSVIALKNSKQHAPVVGNIGFSWKTQTFEGNIQNSLIMDALVLDETEKPFWCFSAPVSLHTSKASETLYDFMGESFFIRYQDSIGRINIELVWVKESEEYYIVNMVLFLSTEKVNRWFGTNY
ncbi:F-box only protein 15 isoform X2 [Xenopus laevis]|nr:F-box only protein 15 isoform X2 [Xenopus laevis]